MKKTWKKIVSLVLAVAMVLPMGSMNAFAAGNDSGDGRIPVPMEDIPSEVKDGTYKVPFHMYNVDTLETREDGKVYAATSMGEITLNSSLATLDVKGSKRTLKITMRPEAVCTQFNYFNSEQDYKLYSESAEQWKPEIQDLKKGGVFTAPKDGVIYTYEQNKGEQGNLNAMTSITFNSTGASQVYFAVKAEGMGESEKLGLLGFDFSKMRATKPVDPDNPGEPENPDIPNVPDVPEVDSGDIYAHPESDDTRIQKFWKVYDYVFKELPQGNNLHKMNEGSEVVKWLEKTAAGLKSGAITEAEYDRVYSETVYYESQYNDVFSSLTSIVKLNNSLNPGKSYEVPVKYVKLANQGNTGILGNPNQAYPYSATNEIAEVTTYLADKVIVNVYEKEYAVVELERKAPVKSIDDKTLYFLQDNENDSPIYTYYREGSQGQEFIFDVKNNEKYTEQEIGTSPEKVYPVKRWTMSIPGCVEEGIYLKATEGQSGTIENYTQIEDFAMVLDYENAVEKGNADPDKAPAEVNKAKLKPNGSPVLMWLKNMPMSLMVMHRNNYLFSQEIYDELLKKGGLVERAEALYSDPNAIQTEVDAVAKELNDYFRTHKNLNIAMREAEYAMKSLKEADYTQDSWNAYAKSANDSVRLVSAVEFDVKPGGAYNDYLVPITEIDWTKYGIKEDPLDEMAFMQATYYKQRLAMQQQYKETLALRAALVNISSLKNAVETVDKLDMSSYTDNSVQILNEAKKYANTVLANSSATKEEVQEAESRLKSAVDGLQLKADKTNLKATIDKADKKVAQTDVYTKASITQLKEQLKDAKTVYYNAEATQGEVDKADQGLKDALNKLVKKSEDSLDKDHLEDGIYTVSVNLWNATHDKESMGNQALYHTAVLTVADGKYTLEVKGHTMTVSGQTGELDAMRLITDGTKPNEDESNYKEMTVTKDGTDCVVNIPLDKVSEYYYGGIKVHTIDAEGNMGYPMGKGWVSNRLRISWDSLALKQAADKFPAFKATDKETGVTVTAPEGVLPKGTKLRVTKVTDEEKVNNVNKVLENLAAKNVPYEVSLYIVVDGEERAVEPANGIEITVKLPVPEDYKANKVITYLLNEDKATALKGTLKDATYSVVTSKTGIFALAEKKDRVVPQVTEHAILSGADQTIDKAGQNVVIKLQGKATDLVGIAVDGQFVGMKNYTVAGDQVTVTFNNDYIRTLKAGKHTVEFTFNNGEVVATTLNLTEAAIKPVRPFPKTGDTANVALWMLSLMAAAGVAVVTVRRKKEF